MLTPSQIERFHRSYLADPNSGCWLWALSLSPKGYAYMSVGGKKLRTNRISYALHKGPVPDGLDVDHKCNVRCCVNPDHLQLLTHRENILRSQNFCALKAKQTLCKRGHPLSGENLKIDGVGGRQCRQCVLASQRASHHRRKHDYYYVCGKRFVRKPDQDDSL